MLCSQVNDTFEVRYLPKRGNADFAIKKTMDKKPTVISMINLKGGVGKTTITVGLADFISKSLLKKVLVIDMDPQCSASMAFLGETRWSEKEKKKETLYHLFKDRMNNRNTFSVQKAIETNVSNISQVV